MLITIPDILNAGELDEVRDLLAKTAWADGRKTAGPEAAKVKRNEQADLSSRTGAALHTKLNDAIRKNAVFQAAAQPARLSRLLVSRSGVGQGYGTHVDNALMGTGANRLRTDLSFTLFLSEPDEYEGGELTIDWAGMVHSMKLGAGSLLLYPSTSLHRVEPVSSGQRTVCVGWVQSQVRTSEQRDILFDLANLKVSMRSSLPEAAPEHLALSKVIANLRRLWSEV